VAEEGAAPVSRLDGEQRRSVATGLWRKWRLEGRGSALLFGSSGVGKSEGIVRPLRDWAEGQGIPTVWVDVPVAAVSFDSLLLHATEQELVNGGHPELAAAVAEADTLTSALRALLRAGALVILDEFQRALESDGRPAPSMARMLEQLGRRPTDTGCLLLVSNRQVDWSWTEPFYVDELSPPNDDADAERIVLQQLKSDEAAVRFPDSRRLEVVHRLGRNPRVLRLLGLLLNSSHLLAELLPPTQTDLTELADPQLVDDIERQLLAKAAEGLPTAARAFLRDISVLRDWADWGLIEAMAAPQANVRDLVRQARERYLLEVRGSADSGSAGLYKVHPLLREVDTSRPRRDEAAWQAANRRAGEWYARKLRAAGRTTVHDRTLLLGLDGAWYHLTAAGADAELRGMIEPLHRYIRQYYGETAMPARTSGERDGRIALLELYNRVWGTAGTYYNLARMLRDRGGPGDLEQAMQYALQATAGQSHSTPWVLWIKLVRAVDGPEAAVAAAREAAEHVAGESLFSIYQNVATYLVEQGHGREAVAALREGISRDRGSTERLAALAVEFAAAEPTDDLLDELISWLSTPSASGLEPTHAQAQALRLERQNRWAEALAVLVDGRRQYPTVINLICHEAYCNLALGDAAGAQAVLDHTQAVRRTRLSATTWCAAFVAVELGRTADAARLLGSYLGKEAAPSTAEGIRERLLYEWDMTINQPAPHASVVFPVLAPALSGLPAVAIRPQYGGPVLPQHQPALQASTHDQPHVLALATAWSPTSGGVNTFNQQLCISMARTARVSCVVLEATDQERQEAADANVTLIEAPRVPGALDTERLSYPPLLGDSRPDVIIGHGRWTGRAARRLSVDYPDAKRLHFLHVIPDDIERYKPRDDMDTAALAEERQEVDLALGADANYAVAVGPRIYEWFYWDFERRGYDVAKLIRFDPGFDSEKAEPRKPPQTHWTVLVTGRMEDDRLKGLDLAARAFNEARRRRRPGTPPVELLVRGAPPEKSTALENQMREWAGDPSMPVRVQPYTSRADRLAADLRGASLVLMPSRAEGFGLVAAEAVAVGTPVLVSSVSGLGELLEELESEEAARIVIPVTRDDDRDVAAWSNAIESALRDRDAEFRRVAALRDRLAAKLTWSGASSQLLGQVCGMSADSGQ